jgi:hypothetical protein
MCACSAAAGTHLLAQARRLCCRQHLLLLGLARLAGSLVQLPLHARQHLAAAAQLLFKVALPCGRSRLGGGVRLALRLEL